VDRAVQEVRNHTDLALDAERLVGRVVFNFLKIYQYYATPFQVIIPLIVWIAAEIKTHKMKTAEQTQRAL
jgi:hypothetical protein